MVVCGREISGEVLQRLEAAASACSRRQLARQLCQWLDWTGPTGRFQLMSARKAICILERSGSVRLPKSKPCIPPRRRFAPASEEEISGLSPLSVSLEALGPIEVIKVTGKDKKLSAQWNQMMDRYHYLGAGPLCGAQLRYLVRCAQGPLAALAFSAAAWRVASRDQWIGWSPAERRENLHLVVNNSRFLILPHVQVPNLASHILARLVAVVPGDWRQSYGYEPVLLESFVEMGRFNGGCYRAANWQGIGVTQGRGRQDARHQAALPRKALWVYALRKDFRAVLCAPPPVARLAPVAVPPSAQPQPPVPVPGDWAEEELGRSRLGGQRLVRRCCKLARAFYARPQAQLPQACGSRAETKAAYRFLDNPRVTMNGILQSHYEATARRVAGHKVILAVQDTTSLNYSAHPATEMLGLIGKEKAGLIGMHVHSTLAFDPAGTPLGLLDVQCWVRPPEEFGKKKLAHQLPFEAKESVRWLRSLQALEAVQPQCPNTQLVGMGDREADIYELFVWATEQAGRPKLLVRALQDRMLAEEQKPLWEHLLGQAVAGELELRVPRQGKRAARTARMEVRFAKVELKAPVSKAALKNVPLWAVLSREQGAPEAVEPLEWLLLTTVPVEDFAGAVEKLTWYAGRWGIEVFHRVLKSGCRIETRQLGGADRLDACLAIDMVVAWRIYYLTKLGRETPEVPCTVYFEEHEWKALVAYVKQTPVAPAEPPSLREAIRMTAGLGGFLGRKSDGEPGTQTLWLGLQRLDDMAAMYLVLRAPQHLDPTVSSNRTYG